MWAWLSRTAQERRAEKYLASYGDDATAVSCVLSALRAQPASSAREAAEKFRGGKLSDAEWARIAWRWERVWAAVVSARRASPHANAPAQTAQESAKPAGIMQQIASDFIGKDTAAGPTFT